MARILVTGPLGHIGSRFIHEIKENEFEEVILLDNLSTQRFPSLFNLPSGVKFRFIQDDILTAPLVDYCKNVDYVLHLAAITNAEGSFEIQEKVEEVNFKGTRRVAEACVAGGAKLIFVSTTSVYGTQASVVDENCSQEELKPQSPYAISKLKAETLIGELGRLQGLQYITCRFGTIFGTSIGMRFHTAVNKFVWQSCLGMPLTVWRTALDQKRPYLDLNDAIRALRFILATERFDRQTYNVLTVNSTVREITDVIRTIVPDLRIEFVDSQIMNQLSYTVACEKFKALGFRFEGSLERSIDDTVRLIRNVRHGF